MDLSTTTRDIKGTNLNALRKSGLVPAELYGHGSENVHLTVPAREFNKVFKEAGTSTVVYLNVGNEKKPALIHHVQKDYLTGDVAHIDFYQVRMDEVITASVTLEFVGDSKAAKEEQAMIMKPVTEIEVEALPADLPHSIIVDLSKLETIGTSIHIKDLAIPKGVKALLDPETVVATATPPTKEEEVAAPAEAVDVAAIPTEGEEKKAEREAGKAEEE